MNSALVILSTVCIVIALSATSSTSGLAAAMPSPYVKPGSAGIARPARGFRPAALSTARGFGKRTPEALGQIGLGDSLPEIPQNSAVTVDMFAEQLIRNPQLARFVTERLIDGNGDGLISPDEFM